MSNFNQVSYYTLNKSLKFILHCNNNKHQLINGLPCLDKPSFVFSLLKPRRKYKKWFIIILPVKLQCHKKWFIIILPVKLQCHKKWFIFILPVKLQCHKKWFIIILPVKCHYWLTIVILIPVYLYSCCLCWYRDCWYSANTICVFILFFVLLY